MSEAARELSGIVAEFIVIWILEAHIHTFGCVGVKGAVAKALGLAILF